MFHATVELDLGCPSSPRSSQLKSTPNQAPSISQERCCGRPSSIDVVDGRELPFAEQFAGRDVGTAPVRLLDRLMTCANANLIARRTGQRPRPRSRPTAAMSNFHRLPASHPPYAAAPG